MELSEQCAICSQPIGTLPKVTLGEKKSLTINKASEERNETVLCVPGQVVHQECRRKYYKSCHNSQATEVQPHEDMIENIALRSTQRKFNFSTDCFFVVDQLLQQRRGKTLRFLQ